MTLDTENRKKLSQKFYRKFFFPKIDVVKIIEFIRNVL